MKLWVLTARTALMELFRPRRHPALTRPLRTPASRSPSGSSGGGQPAKRIEYISALSKPMAARSFWLPVTIIDLPVQSLPVHSLYVPEAWMEETSQTGSSTFSRGQAAGDALGTVGLGQVLAGVEDGAGGGQGGVARVGRGGGSAGAVAAAAVVHAAAVVGGTEGQHRSAKRMERTALSSSMPTEARSLTSPVITTDLPVPVEGSHGLIAPSVVMEEAMLGGTPSGDRGRTRPGRRRSRKDGVRRTGWRSCRSASCRRSARWCCSPAGWTRAACSCRSCAGRRVTYSQVLPTASPLVSKGFRSLLNM